MSVSGSENVFFSIQSERDISEELRQLESQLAVLEAEKQAMLEEEADLLQEKESLETKHSLGHQHSPLSSSNCLVEDLTKAFSPAVVSPSQELEVNCCVSATLTRNLLTFEKKTPVFDSELKTICYSKLKQQKNLFQEIRPFVQWSDEKLKDFLSASSLPSALLSQTFSSDQKPLKFVDDIFLLTVEEASLPAYEETGWVPYSFISSSGSGTNKIDTEAIKQIIPFRKIMPSRELKNIAKHFRDDLLESLSEPFELSFLGFVDPDFSHSTSAFLQEINPRGMKYFFVVKIKDFLVSSKKCDSGKGLIHLNFFEKFIVLKTSFPLSSYFSRFMTSIASSLRQEQTEFITIMTEKGNLTPDQASEMGARRFQQIDLAFLRNYLKVSKESVATFDTEILLPHSLRCVKMPSRKMAYISESEAYFTSVLSSLTFNDFFLIFIGILFEKSVVFVSENQRLISGAIATFQALLRPFKWPHILNYSISENELEFFKSKVPSLIGLCMKSSTCRDKILPLDFKNRIWVFLDLGLIHCHEEISSQLIIPKFEKFSHVLEKIYAGNFSNKESVSVCLVEPFAISKAFRKFKTLNQHDFAHYADIASRVGFNKRTIYDKKYSDSVNPEEKTKIFSYLRFFLNTYVVTRLPRQTKNKETTLANFNMNAFGKEGEEDYEFLIRFFDTQIFAEFVKNDLDHIPIFALGE